MLIRQGNGYPFYSPHSLKGRDEVAYFAKSPAYPYGEVKSFKNILRFFKPSTRRLKRTPYSMNRNLAKNRPKYHLYFENYIYLSKNNKQDLNPEL